MEISDDEESMSVLGLCSGWGDICDDLIVMEISDDEESMSVLGLCSG